MHDIKIIRDDPAAFDAALARRGLEPLSKHLLEIDERRRKIIAETQNLQTAANAAAQVIGGLMKEGKKAEAEAKKAEVAASKSAIQKLEADQREVIAELEAALAAIPNTPLPDVPQGKDEHDNVERHKVGTPREIANAKEHFELGEKLGLMDFETAAKLSGARFVVLKGAMARLERAIASFMLDLHTGTFGYTEVNPPVLVKDAAMFGTAQLPKFADDQFRATRKFSSEEWNAEINRLGREQGYGDDMWTYAFQAGIDAAERKAHFQAVAQQASENLSSPLWLIPTAEVPLTNLVRDSILAEEELPKRLTAWTPCFRAEAGAAGRDTRGMIRQHQFSKVELVSIVTPEKSAEEHERMLSAAEEVLKRLELPYRVMTLCTGDMGFASQKTYDIEVWLPGQKMYREISSCSQCGDFQARRMQARYKAKGEKTTRFVNTLNGSGLAVGRTLVAILENYQQPDGSIAVPPVLQPYMGGLKAITNG